jgi:ABC-type multidrug transport system fused ATPase/permease subunit
VEAVNFFMLTRILLIAIGILLLIDNQLTLGELYFFQFSFFRVLTPFEILGGILPHWNKQVGKIRMSEDIRQTPIEVANKEGALLPERMTGHLELKNVSFAYKPHPLKVIVDPDDTPSAPVQPEEEIEEKMEDERSDLPEPGPPLAVAADHSVEPAKPTHEQRRTVLEHISLDIRPGEHVAFVGHSGAGKSTLAMLLNRFYDVTDGQILIDGTDLRDLDADWWRKQVGLVLQENTMFNDTILENIRYARPDASREEVIEAARRAAASDFIEELPQKYDTLIGDRGIRLSGGQRQRVAIARAILKKPSIVVLDEATSALDSVTEKKVQEGIKELITGRTACIIAHRLSTVRSVDRIAVLDKGKLIAFAPHEELMKTCEIYREMVELQSHGMLAE